MPKKSPWVYLCDITLNGNVISYEGETLKELSEKTKLGKCQLTKWFQKGNDAVHEHKYFESIHLRRVPRPKAPKKKSERKPKVPTITKMFSVCYTCGDQTFQFVAPSAKLVAEHLKISIASVYKLLKDEPLPKLAFFNDLKIKKEIVPIESLAQP